MYPIFGAVDPQPQVNNDQMYQQQQFGGSQFQNQAPPPLSQVPPTGFYQPQQQTQQQQPLQQQQQVNYANFQNFSGQQQQQQPQPQQTMSPPPIVQEPPKQKLPLPEEFIYLQTVLEELKTQCINAAGNPVSINHDDRNISYHCFSNLQQTKRKLDDVSKRLELLYDLLREARVSSKILFSNYRL